MPFIGVWLGRVNMLSHRLFSCYLWAERAETSTLECFGFHLWLQQFARESGGQLPSTSRSTLSTKTTPSLPRSSLAFREMLLLTRIPLWESLLFLTELLLTINYPFAQTSGPVMINAIWLPTPHRPLIPHQQFQLRLRKKTEMVHRPFSWLLSTVWEADRNIPISKYLFLLIFHIKSYVFPCSTAHLPSIKAFLPFFSNGCYSWRRVRFGKALTDVDTSVCSLNCHWCVGLPEAK